MKRYLIAAIILMSAVMMLLTGCRAEPCIDFQLLVVPSGLKGDILVPGEQPDEWISAALLSGVTLQQIERETASQPVISLSVGGTDDLCRAFCETHRKCRIALRNASGGIEHLSEEIVLADPGTAGYPRELTYNCKTGIVKVESWYAKELLGKTPDGWYFISVIAAWLMLIPLSVAMVLLAAFVPDERERRAAENLTLLLCSIPAVLSVIFRIYLARSPVFNLDGDPFSVGDVVFSLLAVFPWTIALIYLAVIAVNSIMKKARKE